MSTDSDDLSKLERQLAAIRPTANGLDADAMLFAAGQAAAARPNPLRWVWPAATCGLAIAGLLLAGGWRSERTQRIELAAKLARPNEAIETPAPMAVKAAEPLSPNSYWSVRRMIEKDGDDWKSQAHALPGSPAVPNGNPKTMRAWPSKSVEP